MNESGNRLVRKDAEETARGYAKPVLTKGPVLGGVAVSKGSITD